MDAAVPEASYDGAAGAIDRLCARWNLQLCFFADFDDFSVLDENDAVRDWPLKWSGIDGSTDQGQTVFAWCTFLLLLRGKRERDRKDKQDQSGEQDTASNLAERG